MIINLVKVPPISESMNSGQPHSLPYTANRARPLARRALITRCPFLVRIRTRNPETRLRLRLVPCSVRCVIALYPFYQEKLKQTLKVTIVNAITITPWLEPAVGGGINPLSVLFVKQCQLGGDVNAQAHCELRYMETIVRYYNL